MLKLRSLLLLTDLCLLVSMGCLWLSRRMEATSDWAANKANED